MKDDAIIELTGMKQICEGLAKNEEDGSNWEMFHLLAIRLDNVIKKIKAA